MKSSTKSFSRTLAVSLLMFILLFVSAPGASAHCDSYAGPVIKDAMQALKTNNVKLVYKWINAADEPEIASLFAKTYTLRNGDKEVYDILEKHFLETLVRVHRASEHAPYTGLKSADSVEPIIKMSDEAIVTGDIDGLMTKLNAHVTKVIKEKFAKMKALESNKDASPEEGRAYVRAYVDYVHTVAGVHSMIDGTAVSGGTIAEGGHNC